MKPIGGTKQNNSNLSKLIDKFHKACTNGNIEYVREVLRSEFRDQVIDSINSELQVTPLCRSILNRQTKIIKILICNYADSEVVNSEGETAIFHAVRIQSINIVNLLIHYSVNLNIQNNKGDTPLHVCCFNGSEAISKLLLKRGANPNLQNKTKGETPLHVAIQCGNIDVAIMLVNFGAKTEILNFQKKTALELATKHDRAKFENNLILQKQSKSCVRNWARSRGRLNNCNTSGISLIQQSFNHSIMQSPANSILPSYYSNWSINKTFDLRGESVKKTESAITDNLSNEKLSCNKNITSSPKQNCENIYKRTKRRGYESLHSNRTASRNKRNESKDFNVPTLSTSMNFTTDRLISMNLSKEYENERFEDISNTIIEKNSIDQKPSNSKLSQKLKSFNRFNSKIIESNGRNENSQSSKMDLNIKLKAELKDSNCINRYSVNKEIANINEQNITIHNKENINYDVICVKPKQNLSKVQLRYSRFEEPEPVVNISKISKRHESRPSMTSECDCSDLMNELMTWREMDERIGNTLDYSSSKENNDIDEAINDPHQIMICNENDIVCSNTFKDTINTNDLIKSEYVKNMRTSLLFSELKIKTEESQNQNPDFMYNTLQSLDSSPIDFELNFENTIVRHRIPHSSLTRQKFHKSISLIKAREFFNTFGEENYVKTETRSSVVDMRAKNKTNQTVKLNKSINKKSSKKNNRILIINKENEQNDMLSCNQSCKFNISEAANALGESMLVSLSCSSKNYSEENEIGIETDRITEGPPTQRTLISELDRAKVVSVDKYKELKSIMKNKNTKRYTKINSEYDLFDSACITESPEPGINPFQNMNVSINNLGARKHYTHEHSFGPINYSFQI